MVEQNAVLGTTVSAADKPTGSGKDSLPEIRETEPTSVGRRSYVPPYFMLVVVGLVILLIMHRRLGRRVELSPRSPLVVPPQEKPERDDWGMGSLEYFEQTIPELAVGKRALAAWASASGGFVKSEKAEEYGRALAHALSKGSQHSLVGMVVALQDVQPWDMSVTERPAPQLLRVTEVVTYSRWNLLVNVEDIVTREEYSAHIPMIRDGGEDVDKVQTQYSVEQERKSIIQAVGKTPAALAASQKGISVPQYTGRISGLDEFHTVGNFQIVGIATLMERAVGSLQNLIRTAKDVVQQARDYIAVRLVHIALKLEHSGVGHLQFDWDSLFVHRDGSFLLGNFASAAPFGECIYPFKAFVTHPAEPSMMMAFDKSGVYTPEAKTNMWSVGILLYQLYTGDENPLGRVEQWPADGCLLSQCMLGRQLDSETILENLKSANVPRRWVELILRLSEPDRRRRIGGFQVLREFDDLL